ncbi:MAG: transcriptional regulator [Chloroflexi bacterium]|nr:transcriptional regulator [Chloroflexota bacterium]
MTKSSAKQAVDVQGLIDVDRVIHEPARLAIVAVLAACESADFVYLRNATGMTQGNLSAHLGKLEEAGYVEIEKRFQGKKPNTLCRLTDAGRTAFKQYRTRVAKLVS